MVRTLQWSPSVAAPGILRRWAATALMSASDVLAQMAARLAAHRAHAPVEPIENAVEFTALEMDGRRYGAIYENGRLVGWLPDVYRL